MLCHMVAHSINAHTGDDFDHVTANMIIDQGGHGTDGVVDENQLIMKKMI